MKANNSFVHIKLSQLNLDKVPRVLAETIKNIQKSHSGHDKDSHDRHSYHSDEPRYDHTRES